METLNANISALKLVEIMCLRDEDVLKRKAVLYLSYLPSVYLDLKLDVTKTTVMRKYYIDPVNKTLAIPNDCLQLVGAGYEDSCGVLQGFWYNSELPIEMIFENGKPCACESCGGEHANCGAVQKYDDTEETVTINGTPYTNTVKTVTLIDGRVIRFTHTATLNSNDTVAYVDKEEELCKIDLLPCGCVRNTPENTRALETLATTCGCFTTNSNTYCCTNLDKCSYNLDLQNRLIVLSPNYDRDYLIIKYYTTINKESDYQIPQIAMECIIAGIRYYHETTNPKAAPFTRGNFGMWKKVYDGERNKLHKKLRPIDWAKINRALGTVSFKDNPLRSDRFYSDRYRFGQYDY